MVDATAAALGLGRYNDFFGIGSIFQMRRNNPGALWMNTALL